MAPKRRKKTDAQVPDVYREMLAETVLSGPSSKQNDRPSKRRRVGGKLVEQQAAETEAVSLPASTVAVQQSDLDELFEEDETAQQEQRQQQEILLSQSEDSADSDVDWENVDLKPASDHDNVVPELSTAEETGASKKLDLVLNDELERQDTRPKRKAVTALEKKLRLEIHKVNLCCLMAHTHTRNHWCNDGKIQGLLRQYLTSRCVSYLTLAENASQFQRSRSFMDGLNQISEIFRGSFRKTSRGMAKPQWSLPDQLESHQVPDDVELPMEKQDFAEAARNMAGSRDTGAQLLCCMLRSIGVETRLVCSLQPFQFRAVEKTATPQKQYSAYVPYSRSRQTTPEQNHSDQASGVKVETDRTPNGQKLVDRRKGPKRPIRESKYPIYWVEAYNDAVQKWVPIDPIVTQTVAKPSKLEPPLGERENDLSYVIAFEEDGSAHDVTRRYAKAYNAKTRRDRIESTKGGERWWRRLMKLFRRPVALSRDQLEAAELAAHEAAEPMPRNVVDFKDHPYYVLERHLRRHEVIHPKREAGKVGATGRGHDSRSLESIYRRRDVQHVQSVDKWFRQGREVKIGEQALKHVTPTRRRGRSIDPDDDDAMVDTERAGTPLFYIHQTTLYRPEPVANGTVPKNQYGNLDVYVPSMIPAGGAHIQHPSASRAAKILGISFADAVTGFKFSGRHGTAILNGVIVAAENVEAVRDVIIALEDEKLAAELEKRAASAVALWRRFLIGLRIRERIEGYDIEGEADGDHALEKGDGSAHVQEDEDEDDDDVFDADAGGFFPEGDIAQDIRPPSFAPPHQTTNNEGDNNQAHHTLSRTLNRPDPIIPIIFGPPLPSSNATAVTGPAALVDKTADRQCRTKAARGDLFEDDGGGGVVEGGGKGSTRDTTPDPEAEAVELAIARSLAEGAAAAAIAAPEPTPPELEPMSGLVGNGAVGAGLGLGERAHGGGSGGGTAIAIEEDEEAEGARAVSEGDAEGEGEGDADADSLLSHDPEDEDADDWPESGVEDG